MKIAKKKSFSKKTKMGKSGKKNVIKKVMKKAQEKTEETSNPAEEYGDDDEDKDLMNFDFDKSDESSDDEDQENENDVDEKIHIPSQFLEVASDEEEEEEEDSEEDDDATKAETPKGKLTLKTVKEWQNELIKSNPSVKFIRNVMLAFNAALHSIADEKEKVSAFKIENPAVFNAVIELCILYLHSAISRYLEVNERSNKNFQKGEKWRKLKNSLRHYFTSLAGIFERISNPLMSITLLKHLHQMSSFVANFTVVTKALLRALINSWSTSNDDSIRVLSFLCILKITRSQQKSLLNHVLKAMYISYIRNCKFVSPNSLAGINFMRRSLIEIFLLDTKLAYQHAFLYIRQLAIHLRNAVILKKKQCFQALHNWQYVNSIKLWADMLGFSPDYPELQPLVYPLVNISIGLLKCTPTMQYYPLRFHCVKALITLSKQASVFIPILPFLLEILKGNLFKKKCTGESFKGMDFTCILRVSKNQVTDNSFKREVVDQIYALSLEYLENQSASIAFPDLVVPSVILIKKFIKTCKDSNSTRKLKGLSDKIQENAKFIDKQRRVVNFALKDASQIKAWEANIRSKGTPISIYYQSWYKTNQVKRKRQATNTTEISDFDLPMIKRKKQNEAKNDDNIDSDDSDFFGKESEDENDDEDLSDDNEEEIVEKKVKNNTKKNKMEQKEVSNKKKKVKKSKIKKMKKENVGINDEVENLNIDEW